MDFFDLPEHRSTNVICYQCARKTGTFLYTSGLYTLGYCSKVCAIHATSDQLFRVKRLKMADVAKHYGVDPTDYDSPELDLLLTLFAHGEG